MRPVGIGLAGLGRWGRNYVKTLFALPECRLVAAADADPTTHAAIAGETGITVRESAAQLLSDPAIEAVVIATPDRTHYSLASAALCAGRDVLVEKPMALEPDEAEALAEQAESSGRVLAVGHTAVYQSGFAELVCETRSRPLDADKRASAVRTSSGYADDRTNPILDLCPHDIALAVLLFGTPEAARARANGKGVEYEVRFKGPELLNGQVEWREPPHVRRFEVAGAKSALCDGAGGHSSPDIRETPLGRQCMDFIECCRTRRQPLSSGRVGLAVMRCISALTSSYADGNTWVQIPSKLQTPHCQTGAAEANAECLTSDSELRTSNFGVRT
ncbi:MAG: Gfo/Idh/MocA family oxidoreductase [candidate division WOR-3 bacterium]|nr:Gfo/Idh/MocA family oxidoreductase [candidate division WOR-3 bacterium]